MQNGGFLSMFVISLLGVAGRARATIPLPDSGSCVDDACLTITDTYAGGSSVVGTNVNGTGLKGSGVNGVIGSSVADKGIGVTGTTTGTFFGDLSNGFVPACGVYGQAQTTVGVFGRTGGQFGTGVVGTSTASSNGTGVSGTASGPFSTGVFGQASFAGVQGYSTATGGVGVSAVAGGPQGHAVEGVCNGSCASQPNGYAGYFKGSIAIETGTAAKPGGGSWAVFSDARIKKDVKAYSRGLADLERVRPVTFRYNGLTGIEDTKTEYVGVIAQEIEKVFPTMVTTRSTKLNKDDATETDIKQVDPSGFTYMLINAVNEQQQIIRRQEARLASLEKGRGPALSSILSGGTAQGVAMVLLPLSLVAALYRRREQRAG